MSAYKNIEHALTIIDPGLFQELCKRLIGRMFNIQNLSSPGSQAGTNKTTKGTPDIYFSDSNGYFSFIECSTDKTGGVKKIKRDLVKCVNENKIKVSKDKISRLIVFTNFKLQAHEVDDLYEHAKSLNKDFLLLMLEDITRKICEEYPWLGDEYMQVPIDTGQVLNIDTFIYQYSSAAKAIATPLDNPFLHREEELKIAQNLLIKNNIVVFRGRPGIGKTKLALKVIEEFLDQNQEYKGYCIVDKSTSIINDLHRYLDGKGKYILLIDDANSFKHISELAGYYESIASDRIKLILTVRDYAVKTIETEFANIQYEFLGLQKFDDDSIVEIIKGEPFNIKEPILYEEIIRISSGNARIAIMIARILNEKRSSKVFGAVEHVFETYFRTFLPSNPALSDVKCKKVLAIVSFFGSLPINREEDIRGILTFFNLSFSDYQNMVELLQSCELGEIDFNFIRIPEQTISSYFLYDYFFCNNSNQLEEFFFEFYRSHIKEMSEFFNSSLSFDSQKVYDTVKPILLSFIRSNTVNYGEEKLSFYRNFLVFLQKETLGFIQEEIEHLPNTEWQKIEIDLKSKNTALKYDPILRTINDLLYYAKDPKELIITGLHYVSSKQELFSSWVDILIRVFKFDRYDAPRYSKQFTLLEVLLEGLNSNQGVFRDCFFSIVSDFFTAKFRHSRSFSERKIIFSTIEVQLDENLKKFRRIIWETLSLNYEIAQTEVFLLLNRYLDKLIDINQEFVNYDLPFIYQLIEEKFNTKDYQQCKIAQRFSKLESNQPELHYIADRIKKKFENNSYILFLKLEDANSSYFMGENKNISYDLYRQQKLREYFHFNTISEIDSFILCVHEIIQQEKKSLSAELDSILCLNFDWNVNLSIYLLESIAKNNNVFGCVPALFIIEVAKNNSLRYRFLEIIGTGNFELKPSWELEYYRALDEVNTHADDIEKIFNAVRGLQTKSLVGFNGLQKYNLYKSSFTSDLLQLIISNLEKDGRAIILEYQFIEVFLSTLEKDTSLLKRAYYILENQNQYFDYNGETFLLVLQRDHEFLLEWISRKLNQQNSILSNDQFIRSCIWSVENIEDALEKVFTSVISHSSYNIFGSHFLNIFFQQIDRKFKERSREFLLDYLQCNYQFPKHVSCVFDIARLHFKDSLKDFYSCFLQFEVSEEYLRQVEWITHEVLINANESHYEIERNSWLEIQREIASMRGYKGYRVFENFISGNISSLNKSLKMEQRRAFIGKQW